MQVPILGFLGGKNGALVLCDGVNTGVLAELGLGFTPWAGVLDDMLFNRFIACRACFSSERLINVFSKPWMMLM